MPVPVDPATPVFSGGAVTSQVQPGFRAKEFEDTQWRSLAETWVGYLQPFVSSSPFFKDLGELAVDRINWRILRGKAVGTLRRHLSGLKLWLDFTHGSEIVTANAEVSTVVSFVSCVQLSVRAMRQWCP